jgi:propanol-preferring alcohol dehydrogenase
MRAMVLERLRAPLVLRDRATPEPGPGEVRVAIEACAVCRTDLHVVDGELPDPRLPIVPGHQIDPLGRNLTRRDGEELLALAPAVGLRPHVTTYPLEDANRALDDLRAGRFEGTAVLAIRGAS